MEIEKPPKEIATTVRFLHGKNHKPFKSDIYLGKFYLAGWFYYINREEVFDKIKVKDKLQLFREPKNKYDKKAIVVKRNNEKIGYVPRKDNYVLSHLLDNGKGLYGIVESIEEIDYGDVTISFKIFLKD